MRYLAVVDTSPLIALHQIGRRDQLRGLFREVVVPPAVVREVAPSLGPLPSWIREQRPPAIPNLALPLDAGEREAIALAVHLTRGVIVLDEHAGRRKAVQLGLDVVGSAGLLLQARRDGLPRAVKPELDAMIANGFVIGQGVYRAVIEAAGEDG